MINGTLAADVGENATVLANLTDNANSQSPSLQLEYPFCEILESVEQDDGQQCPPREGGVEVRASTVVPPFLRDHNISARIEAWTANKTRITCLNSTLEIRGPYG